MHSGRNIGFLLRSASFAAALTLGGCATATAPSRSPEVAAELRAERKLPRNDVTAETRAQQLFIRAMTQANIGNHQAALDLYTEALSAAPNESAILAAAAESYEAVGDETSAIYNVRRARDLSPENPHYHFQLAQLHLSNGDSKTAASIYSELLKRFPGNIEALYELARVLTIGGDFASAIETYELLLKEIGTDRDIQDEILQLYVRLGDQAGMERTLKRMVDDQPHDARLRRMLGEMYLGQNRTEDAARQLEEALESNPGDFEILLSLTDAYRAAGMTEKADSLLERAGNMEGATPEELVAQAAPLYARANEDSEARETAVQILLRVLEMDARNAQALIMLGDLHIAEGEFAKAADLL